MNDDESVDERYAWFAILAGFVHRWEFRHDGSLEGFPETKSGVQRLAENGSAAEVLRNAPDFRLDIGAEFVLVSVEGEPVWRISRHSAGTMSKKHHQVPRMLIKRWANKEGRVLWRRSQGNPGRVVPMRPGKIMRRSGAYAVQMGLDPRLIGMSPKAEATDILEGHLGDLERGTAPILRQIDELVERTPDGRSVRWQDELLLADEVLKLFILHQMIRTEESRRRLETDVPLDDWIRTARRNTTGWTDADTGMARQTHRNWLAIMTSVVDPDHPWYTSVVGSETEIYVGLPDPPADVFPLTDNPVWSIPMGRQTMEGRRTYLGAWPFLPISPRVGIGIKPPELPTDDVKCARIPVDYIMQYCVGIAEKYSEVVLPWERSRVWDIFGAR